MTDQISLEKRLQEYLALMVVLFAEVESLRERVTETEKECDIVRRNSMIPNRIDRGRSLSLRK